MMKMKNLEKLYKECLLELDAIGIQYGKIASIKENSRLTKTWGNCRRISPRNTKWEDCSYEIKISSRLLNDSVDDNAVKNTIIHEILHTCENCLNHGNTWKIQAEKVNREYPQYNIKRTTSFSEKGISENDEYKYIIECSTCHRKWRYRKKTKVVNMHEFLKCPFCKTTTLTLKEN